MSRIWIQANSADADYLGFHGSCLVINSANAGVLFQIIFCSDYTANIAWRKTAQNNISFSHETQLFKITGEVINF